MPLLNAKLTLSSSGFGLRGRPSRDTNLPSMHRRTFPHGAQITRKWHRRRENVVLAFVWLANRLLLSSLNRAHIGKWQEIWEDSAVYCPLSIVSKANYRKWQDSLWLTRNLWQGGPDRAQI